MSTITVYAATTAVNDSSVGTKSWSNISKLDADDANSASFSSSAAVISYYVRVSPQSLAAIPSGVTPSQIDIKVNRRRQLGSVTDNSVRIYKSGTGYTGSDMATGGSWPLTFTVANYIWDETNWGTGWTRNEIVNNLQFAISVNTNNAICYIDSVQYVITYFNISMSMPLLGLNTSFFGPEIKSQTLFIPFQDSTLTMFNQDISYSQILAMPYIDDTMQVYTPGMSFSLSIPLIASTLHFYGFSMSYSQSMHIPYFVESTTMYGSRISYSWANADSLTNEVWTDVDIPV